jgi:multidrug transporter EmrE-like cation transporter
VRLSLRYRHLPNTPRRFARFDHLPPTADLLHVGSARSYNSAGLRQLPTCRAQPMQTPVLSIVFFILAALLGAVGQFLYKSGAERTTGSWLSYLANPPLLVGIVCYVLVMMLFVAAFKRGGAMSVLYPIYATTFIWAAIIAWLAFHEPIRVVNVAGMVLLVAGMCLMGMGK